MRIGFVTDEISDDLQDAITTGLQWGIRDFELRVISGRRVPDIESETLQYLQRLRDEQGIRITGLSPGIFKTPLDEDALLEKELQETLPRTLELAARLEAPLVIVFGFQKRSREPQGHREKAKRILARAADIARPYNITLAVENEPGFWCDTGSATAALLRELDRPNLRANWDPANAYGTEELPYPDGYLHIRPYIANLHIKDTPSSSLSRCVPVGEGKVDWDGQLRAIKQDGILDLVVIETHCEPLKENSLKNLQRVRAILGMD